MDIDFLGILGLKPAQKRVLIDIVENGTSSAADIAKRLNMPKPSVYDSLSALVEMSFVNEYGDDRGKTFGISEKEQIGRVQSEKLENLRTAQTSLLSFIDKRGKSDSVARPKIKFYAGTLGIKQAFRDMMWQKDLKECYMFWPSKAMLDVDEEFFRWHGSQRYKYGVFIYAIENHEDRKVQGKKRYQWLSNTPENLAEARYLPKGVTYKMSFWLYGNKCLFASGGSEKIAFTVHSKEFAEIMKVMWQAMWEKALD